MNDNNTNRVDAFRQFKRQIRGSRDYLIVGLDIAKRKHQEFFGDANGRTLLKGSNKAIWWFMRPTRPSRRTAA